MLHGVLCSDAVSLLSGHTALADLLGTAVPLQGTAAAKLLRHTVKVHVGMCKK